MLSATWFLACVALPLGLIQLVGALHLDFIPKLAKVKDFLAAEINNRLRLIPGIDPEVFMNVSQLITSKGYPCEDYTVETEDGYLLGVQRIPHGLTDKSANRPVVFLQHGLLCSATNWVANPANESLAFILADAGYDVWLGNNRGNTYSLRHKTLNPNQDDFWDFSFDEFATYDFTAQLNFALKQSGQSELHYIGHSQGTLQAFAALSRSPEMNQKVKNFIALGPVITVGDIISPLKYLSDFPDQFLFDTFGRKDFLPHNEILEILADTVCQLKETRAVCANVLFLIAGYDTTNLNKTRLPVYISHTPAGTSMKDIIHFSQGVRSSKFQMYDYGTDAANQKHYNQTSPPLYDVNNMNTTVYLFYAENDWLADVKDVKKLMASLTRGQLAGSFYIPKWNHLDFIWSVDAPSVVYNNIIKILNGQH